MQIALTFDACLSVNGVRSDVADIGPFEVTVNIPDRTDLAEFESQIIRETGPALAEITNMILAAGITQRAVEAAHRALTDATDDEEQRAQHDAGADAAANATAPGDVATGVKTDAEIRQEQNLPLPGEPGHPTPVETTEGEVGGDLPDGEAGQLAGEPETE